jgi:hypothetical protein
MECQMDYCDLGDDDTIDKNSPNITNPRMNAETTIKLKLPCWIF